ncbi:MAG: sigma factor [Aureliella sp.]
MDEMRDASPRPRDDKGFAWSLIRTKAKGLIRSAELPAVDQDDLEQTLALELWQSQQSFDSGRGTWQAFATTVVKNAAGKLLRYRRTKRRDDRATISLNAIVFLPSGEPIEMAQTITQDERGKHLGVDSPVAQVHADLTMDLAAVNATLPEKWQDVLAHYWTASNAGVVEATGLKRHALFGLKRGICKRLRLDGFENYFEN